MNTQWIVLSFLSLSTVIGCGSSSAGGPTTLEGLPKATGAVSTASSVRKALQSSASGVVLKDAVTATFAGKSRVMCEMSQMVKEVLREASQPDKIQCYLGVMEKYGAFSGSYDGSFKHYELAGVDGGGGGATMKIKFKAAKGADGTVNAFQMFNCEGATQSEYLSTTIIDGIASLNVASVHSNSDSNGTYSGSQRVSVNGNYVGSAWGGEKTIVSQTVYSNTGGPWGDYTSSRYTTLVQGGSSLSVTGSGSGTYSGGSHQVLMHAIIQGIGMGNIATFALGDGTGKGSFVYNGGTHTGLASWSGDSRLNLSDAALGDYYEIVNATALPPLTAPSTAFHANEIWDCSAADGFSAIDFTALQSNPAFVTDFTGCDETFGFGEDHAWIECPHTGE